MGKPTDPVPAKAGDWKNGGRILEFGDTAPFPTSHKTDLADALHTYRAGLKPTAMIWVSWPKKSAKVATDITEDTIREIALPLGLVDIKVCAVTDVWSGLKLVLRKELR